MATTTRRRYGNPKAPMTNPQRDMLTDLLATRDVDEDFVTLIEAKVDAGMTSGAASAFISVLLAADRLPRDDEPEDEGWYKHDGVIYKVQRAKKGHLYALGVDEAGRYKVLAKGVMRTLSSNDMLSDAQARRLRLI